MGVEVYMQTGRRRVQALVVMWAGNGGTGAEVKRMNARDLLCLGWMGRCLRSRSKGSQVKQNGLIEV